MFLHLSDSVHRGVSVQGVFVQGGSLSKGVSVQEVSVQWGSLSNGGLCPVGGLCQGDPPYCKERAVRILLECILVTLFFHFHCSSFK